MPRPPGTPQVARGPSVRQDVYIAYWHFAAERQRIFESRLAGLTDPWTEDEILQRYRFCNSFRASDRVSQYLIRRVIYEPDDVTPVDRVLRTIYFRLFSRPQTWELIEERCGLIRADTLDVDMLGQVLDEAMKEGQTLYTSAFILCANRAFGFARKHRNHLALIDLMRRDQLFDRVLEASTLEEVFKLLRAYPLIGDFMAYQLAVDLNYGPDFSFDENDFTVPGPGARRGIAKVFTDLGSYSPLDAIRWLVDQQEVVEDHLGVSPPSLFGRPLHAIDCQNLLCEVDKYSRVKFPHLVSNRQRIKQSFSPVGKLPKPFYPPRWGISPSIETSPNEDPRVRHGTLLPC